MKQNKKTGRKNPSKSDIEKALDIACRNLCLIRCTDSPCGLNDRRCRNECLDGSFWKEKLLKEASLHE